VAILSNDEITQLYRRIAPFYDALAAKGWLGVRRHRELAVRGLQLQPEDVVVDLCCGTGLNFALLHDAVGARGRIIGVDLSPDMLDRARRRADRKGYDNVELVRADVASYAFPPGVDSVISTYGLEMVPEYDDIIRRAATALPGGARLSVYGLKHPDHWPRAVLKLAILAAKPFGVSREYESFRPYESVRRHLLEADYREFLKGAAYLSVGERSSESDPGDSRPSEAKEP